MLNSPCFFILDKINKPVQVHDPEGADFHVLTFLKKFSRIWPWFESIYGFDPFPTAWEAGGKGRTGYHQVSRQ